MIWKGAFDAIKDATIILFIGYSFPETDGFIRSLFQSAAIYWENSPVVHVIDPRACDTNDLGKRYKRYFRPIGSNLKLYPKGFLDALSEGVIGDILRLGSVQGPD